MRDEPQVLYRVSVIPARYHEAMSDAHDLVTDTGLKPEELEWLNERMAEYRDLLEYLREH